MDQRIQLFQYVDVLIAHSMSFSRRDCVYVGKKLEIEIFKNRTDGAPFGDMPYANADGSLKTEKYSPFAFSWFTDAHALAVQSITQRYLNDDIPQIEYNLAVYFIFQSDSKLRFRSAWTGRRHETDLPTDTVRKALKWLQEQGAIRRLSKGTSTYQVLITAT